MHKNILLTLTVACSLLIPATQSLAAGIQHNNQRLHTPVLGKPFVAPRRVVLRRAHWSNHSYNRGYYVAAGIILGLVIADIKTVPETSVVSFVENGVTYFVVNGRKSVIVAGQFIAVN